MRTLLAVILFMGTLMAVVALDATANPTVSLVETLLRRHLDKSLDAFNHGDFEGYLHDIAPRVEYNGIEVERARLLEINHDLRRSFPNLRMRYRSIDVSEMSDTEANVTTVAEFSGSTSNYDASGLSGTYREIGQVTAMYRKKGDDWIADTLQVAWNDSFIDVGQDFGLMGFSNLPVLAASQQSYWLRFFVGDDSFRGTFTEYAYALVPLSTVLAKNGAEEVYRALRFAPIPRRGIVTRRATPSRPGTYAHVLVVPKVLRQAGQEVVQANKIYTRLVQVE
ncbi:MAG: hypothetical protein VKN33_04140 [Candidatus Sericytochromatia bacterium]|nr:hypothetical protein [Candidatus Sericytochromatia bacterium]